MCSRIAIIVDGKLACVGTSQELKSPYSKGYILIVNIDSKERAQELHNLIKELTPGMKILEIYGKQVTLSIFANNSITAFEEINFTLPPRSPTNCLSRRFPSSLYSASLRIQRRLWGSLTIA